MSEPQRHKNSSAPRTEGVKYVGSKLRLIPHIMHLVEPLGAQTALDAFSGTTRVAQAFAQCGLHTHANDLAVWSEVFGNCYLIANKPEAYYLELIDHLNAQPGHEGWFTQHYGGLPHEHKKPFQAHNTMKIDAIREEIDRLDLEWTDRCVLLTSLMLAMNAVDNTLGHFAAYLSEWAPRSYRTLTLTLPRKFRITTHNRVSRGDALEAVSQYHDLAYLDPPYGSNNAKMPPSRVRYAAYYHLWKTLVLNDRPTTFGKAVRRTDSSDKDTASRFEDFRSDDEGQPLALKAIGQLIAATNARHVLLSYSSGGRADKDDLIDILKKNGKLLQALEIDHRRNVMASMTWTGHWANSKAAHKEYLFLLERS